MERWAWINGYEGLYVVSDKGRVFGLPKTRTPGHILAIGTGKTGYRRVCLSKDGIKRTHALHRVVAEAFIPNPEGKPEVNHKNGDKADNRAANLEWTTRSENQRHAYHVLGKKANRPWAGKPRTFARRFTDEQVRAIRADSRPCTVIGAEYGVSKTAIRDIKRRKNYQEVK